jgi:sugar lactone lactonase YvrE
MKNSHSILFIALTILLLSCKKKQDSLEPSLMGVGTFAGTGTTGSTNGIANAASFNDPTGITIDAAGNIFVADFGNNLIRKITASGFVTTIAGSGKVGKANGSDTSVTFYNPEGIVVDASGNLFVADRDNNLIRKISSTGYVSTFAGSGIPDSTNGKDTTATFNNPSGIAIDASGNLYVADRGNNIIRKITSAGIVTTFAGSGSPGSSNGTGDNATFNFPQSLAIDGFGNVYVADRYNNQIRKISPNAVVTTLAGSGIEGNSDGPGNTASFNQPSGVALDSFGNVYEMFLRL